MLLPSMFEIAQKLAGLGGVDPFNSPWLSAWRGTSWFLKRIPESERGGLAIEALRKTKALSVASILIHLSDPADRKEGESGAFDPTLDLSTVEAMKAEWLRLMRIRASDVDALITEPDLISCSTDGANMQAHWTNLVRGWWRRSVPMRASQAWRHG